ncbi:MAG: AraC family transcriptional regulator [Sphingobium sp.]|uniref:helix-turn-helix domain-containing protein n=1 Tax=Sphingobium sp. TaxID=1912891 RepID=UPI0029A83963|nr:AraC family transcriptional regulator [Sphingobium sp.]MDX3910781.1 AraC family transcriptional regulator [Sphingobium sp.]
MRNYFGAAYRFTTTIAPYADVTRADAGQLRFMLRGSGEYAFHNGNQAATPAVCLLGPTMGATSFRLGEPADVWGISLLPLGWVALESGDVSELTDNLADMAATRSADYREFLEHLQALRHDNQAVAADIWQFLQAHLRPVSPSMLGLVSAVDAWLARDGSPNVADLVAATGLSNRQVARLTNRLYGGPPKLLARKYRALRCAVRIAVDQTPWQELCDASTFYDQSHFIREIKHFVGLTPHQLMTDPTEVARLTLQRRDMGLAMAEINRIS